MELATNVLMDVATFEEERHGVETTKGRENRIMTAHGGRRTLLMTRGSERSQVAGGWRRKGEGKGLRRRKCRLCPSTCAASSWHRGDCHSDPCRSSALHGATSFLVEDSLFSPSMCGAWGRETSPPRSKSWGCTLLSGTWHSGRIVICQEHHKAKVRASAQSDRSLCRATPSTMEGRSGWLKPWDQLKPRRGL